MITKKRPFGVSILAVSNVLLAPLLLTVGVQVFRGIFRAWTRLPQIDEDLIIGFALDIAIFILAMVCGVAGVDLWRLRNRGRTATIFFMCIFGILSAVQILVQDHPSDRDRVWLRTISGVVCVLCVAAIVYLLLPRIRRKFETNSSSAQPAE
jgi:uncharacterized BrkB/YihY/UPF0761 family membrane protein